MRWSKPSGEAAVLPWTIHMVAIVIAACIVTYPFVSAIHMWSVRMTRLVGIITLLHLPPVLVSIVALLRLLLVPIVALLDLLLAHVIGLVRGRCSGSTIGSRSM